MALTHTNMLRKAIFQLEMVALRQVRCLLQRTWHLLDLIYYRIVVVVKISCTPNPKIIILQNVASPTHQ